MKQSTYLAGFLMALSVISMNIHAAGNDDSDTRGALPEHKQRMQEKPEVLMPEERRASMSPEEKERFREHRRAMKERWRNMSDEEKARIRERRQAMRERWSNMSEEEREALRKRRHHMREKFRSMSPEERREMHERFRNATPEERREMWKRHHPGTNDEARRGSAVVKPGRVARSG